MPLCPYRSVACPCALAQFHRNAEQQLVGEAKLEQLERQCDLAADVTRKVSHHFTAIWPSLWSHAPATVLILVKKLKQLG